MPNDTHGGPTIGGNHRPLVSVRLDLVADPALVRVARLVVSGIGSVTPMDLEEIEDCRAAVDELCSTLLEVGSSDGVMELEFSTDGHQVEGRGELAATDGRTVDKARSALSSMILSVVTDDHEVTIGSGRARFRFVKAAASRRAATTVGGFSE